MSENIVFHNHRVTKEMRSALHKCRPCVLWFTGLSGSGKSTIAGLLEETLYKEGLSTYLLDGDNVRHGLNKDLGFSDDCRTENIRRAGELSKLFIDAGLLVISAFISPFEKDRMAVRRLLESGEFIEVYIDCPLDICEDRDPKGLYKKARKGEIKKFTGIDSDYEVPIAAEISVDTAKLEAEESVSRIIEYLKDNSYLI